MKNESGLRPLGYRLLIKPLKVDTVSKGGIILPETAVDEKRHKQFIGEIIEMGKNCFDRSTMKPQVGMWVFYSQFEGQIEQGKDGEEYRVINDDHVNAYLDDNETIEPLWFNVLLEPHVVEEKGGIALPDNYLEREKIKQTRGKVVAVSEDAYLDIGESVSPGDDVIFTKYAGSILRHHDNVYRILKDMDIGATLIDYAAQDMAA